MKVSCFGDSNTYGYDPRSWIGGRYTKDCRWVDILLEKTGWEITNLGENGRCIPSTAISFPSDTDLLIVMLGTNDLLQGCTPETISERMKRFLLSLGLNSNKILLIAPPPLTPGEWVPDETLVHASRLLARCYRTLSEQLETQFVDAGNWNIALAFDGVHFTGPGHRMFADCLYHHLIDSVARIKG